MADNGDPVPPEKMTVLWKYGVLFYGLAWPFVLTANLLFFVLVKDDLMQQISIDNGDE